MSPLGASTPPWYAPVEVVYTKLYVETTPAADIF